MADQNFRKENICGSFVVVLVILLLPLSAIMFFVSFFMGNWSLTQADDGSYVTSGLWRRCRHTEHFTTCSNLLTRRGSESFLAAQVSAVVAVICLLLGLFSCGVYLRRLRESAPASGTGFILTAFLLSAGCFGISACVSFVVGDQIDTQRLISQRPGVHPVFHLSYAILLAGLSSFVSFTLGVTTALHAWFHGHIEAVSDECAAHTDSHV